MSSQWDGGKKSAKHLFIQEIKAPVVGMGKASPKAAQAVYLSGSAAQSRPK